MNETAVSVTTTALAPPPVLPPQFAELERFIERMYDETKTFVSAHPFEDSETGRPEA